MNEFKSLQRQVQDSHIQMVHIDGVPRSMSTALGRGLAGGPNSLYVNEPFNRTRRDIGQAAHALLMTYETSEHPVQTLITKSIARNLSQRVFKSWSGICDSTIWSVRDPLTQMGSLLTRVVNDQKVERGADVITQDEIYPHLGTVATLLEEQDFAQTGWQAIGDHYRNRDKAQKTTVVDGQMLASNPELTIRRICDRNGIIYHPAMVNDWQGVFHNANDSYVDKVDSVGASQNMWVKKAVSSRGFEQNHRPQLDLGQLPVPIRRHILDVALPTYHMMLEDK